MIYWYCETKSSVDQIEFKIIELYEISIHFCFNYRAYIFGGKPDIMQERKV